MTIDIWRDDSGKIFARVDDKESAVALVKYFPLTFGENSFGIFEIDADGKKFREIASVFDFGVLTERSRALVHEEFAQRYRMIEIKKIRSITAAAQMLTFEVDTPNGTTVFKSKDNEKSVFTINSITYMHDDSGRIFYVDQNKLDGQSKTILEEYA